MALAAAFGPKPTLPALSSNVCYEVIMAALLEYGKSVCGRAQIKFTPQR